MLIPRVGGVNRPGAVVRGQRPLLAPSSAISCGRLSFYLVINDSTNVFHDQTQHESAEDSPRARIVALYAATGAVPYHLRTPAQIEGFFAGLELIDPGVVPVSQWRPEATPSGPPVKVDSFCGVGRKP
jgi:hypothetical protein